MVSAAVACLPAAVSLLLLAALFMQISGVSLALTWPQRLCLLRVLKWEPLLQAFPFPSTLGKVTLPVLRPACLFTVHVGGGSSLLACAVFLPLPLSQAFLLLVAGRARGSPACRACLFTVLWRIPLPQSLALRALHPLSGVSLLFFLLICQFLFFPGWRSVCPGGYAALAQACLWEYHGTAKLTGPCLPKPSGCGWLEARGPPGFSV
jgi:hypothetical protein